MAIRMLVTVFPDGSCDLFDAEMHDENRTSLVYSWDDLEEILTEWQLYALQEGEEVTFTLPEESEFSYESEKYTIELATAAFQAEVDAQAEAEWTQERIGEFKMLHGYDPREDW